MKYIFLQLYLLLAVLFFNGCKTGNNGVKVSEATSYPFNVISDSTADLYRITSLIDSLDTIATESAGFWSYIANNPNYNKYQRGVCALALIKRHVHNNMPLPQVYKTIGKVNWIEEGNVYVRLRNNAIPWEFAEVMLKAQDCGMYRVHVFPELADTVAYKNIPGRELIFYLMTSHNIPVKSLVEFLREGETDSMIDDTKTIMIKL